MSQICTKCSTSNKTNARFCSDCGQTLGATMIQQRTVIAQPSTGIFDATDEQIKKIVKNVEKHLGKGNLTIRQEHFVDERSGQKEATFLIIDISGSMTSNYDGKMTKLEAAIRACITMVLDKFSIDPNDEMGLICFNTAATCLLNLCPLSSHKPQILQAIQSLQIMGGTNIDSGLVCAQDNFNLNRSGWTNRIILLTDGQGGHPLATAEALKAQGVIIDVIGVGSHPTNVDEKLLKKVASVIEGEVRYKFIKDSQTLVKTFTQLAGKTATY